MKSITVEAKIENVDKVTEFVNEVLEDKECPLKVQMQLDVAIDEIFGNIAYYAYGKGSGNATIQIEMEDNPPKITLIFIDQGTPYNPLENKDPDITLDIEDREIGGLGIGTWTKPLGGYFISFDSMDGCAKAIVARAKEAGVILTGAGATYPYGKDPHDSNIRIAPTYPPLGDLIVATELFALCVKLTSAEKLLREMEQNPQPVKKKEADQQLPE